MMDHIIHRNKLNAWCRQRAIEMALTDKHVRGWQTFLDSNCGYLLTMEDDAALLPDTADTFLQALAILEQYSPEDDLVYFDLAGGLDTNGLQIGSLRRELEQNRFRRMSKITTNTTCCFIMSRALVEDFATRVQKRPQYRKVVSDWLINTLLIDQAATAQRPHYCLHAEPPIMIHGSIQGLYASTIRDMDD